jgi:chemotaxis protein histidine kinase CheA
MSVQIPFDPGAKHMAQTVRDDLDPELLPVFLEEAGELYPQIAGALLAWREQPDNAQIERKLIHNLHTLKGSARMTGALRLGELVHLMEDHMDNAAVRGKAEFWDALQDDFVRIGGLIGELGHPPFISAPPVEAERNQQGAALVPFGSIGKRLYRVVRQTGMETGKQVNLELHGIEIEVGRSLLDRMTAPFEHLLRNAVAHGLEDPLQRERSGKVPIGDVTLSLRRDGAGLVFECADDGAGLDLARLRAKAVELGLLRVDEIVPQAHLMQLIFCPGVTTASSVTEISGRGVGMDVVRSEIVALGGRIDVSSQAGKGTTFTIRLPYAAIPQQ